MENNNYNIVSMDIGNLTTEVETAKSSQIFESRLKEVKSMELLEGNSDVFEKDGKIYKVGEGHFQNENFKFEKDNFVDLLHYGIANNMKSGNVKLITCIPSYQYNEYKDKLKNKIMSNNKINLKIGDETKNITIEEVNILPEGYPIFQSIKSRGLELVEGVESVLVDVGGGTCDISFYDVNGKFINGDSIPMGLLDLYKSISANVINYYPQLQLNVEDAKEYYRGKKKFIGQDEEKDRVFKETYTKEFFEEFFNDLKGKVKNISSMNVIIAGGGAEVLGQRLKDKIPQTIIHTDITVTAKALYGMKVAQCQRKK